MDEVSTYLLIVSKHIYTEVHSNCYEGIKKNMSLHHSSPFKVQQHFPGSSQRPDVPPPSLHHSPVSTDTSWRCCRTTSSSTLLTPLHAVIAASIRVSR